MATLHSLTVWVVKFDDGSEGHYTNWSAVEAAHNSGRGIKSTKQGTKRVLCSGRKCPHC